MCELWEAKSRHRESCLFFHYSFRTPTTQFSGGSLQSHGEPQTRTTLVPLTIKGVLPPAAGGRVTRVFDRLIAALTSLQPLSVWLDTRLRGEMGG